VRYEPGFYIPEDGILHSHRREILRFPIGFDRLAAVVMSVAFFWYIAPRSPYVNGRFGGLYRLHLQGRILAEQETWVKQVDRQKMTTFVTRCLFNDACSRSD
jgi:hypothetical protein